MSRKVPIYFDRRIDLVDIIRAIRPHGWTLKGDARGAIIVVPLPATESATLPNNVVKFRR